MWLHQCLPPPPAPNGSVPFAPQQHTELQPHGQLAAPDTQRAQLSAPISIRPNDAARSETRIHLA
jgi:hypothetical protein